MMRRDPVVGENRVWFFRLSCVFKDMHVYPSRAQRLHGCVEFFPRHQCQSIGAKMRSALKRIICRRLRIGIKPARADHQHRVGALRVDSTLRHWTAAYYPTRLRAAPGRSTPLDARRGDAFQSPKEISTSRAVCTNSPFGGTSLKRLTASAIGTWRT